MRAGPKRHGLNVNMSPRNRVYIPCPTHPVICCTVYFDTSWFKKGRCQGEKKVVLAQLTMTSWQGAILFFTALTSTAIAFWVAPALCNPLLLCSTTLQTFDFHQPIDLVTVENPILVGKNRIMPMNDDQC